MPFPLPIISCPLLYVLGSNDGRRVTTFNNHLELDAMAMTGYLIEE